jgi:hypothetical protein
MAKSLLSFAFKLNGLADKRNKGLKVVNKNESFFHADREKSASRVQSHFISN